MRFWRIAGIVMALVSAGFAILLLLEKGGNAEVQALSQTFALVALALLVADIGGNRSRPSQ
jgi:hypothetical protein